MNNALQSAHPLQFFIDLIDNDGISILKQEFYRDELGVLETVNQEEGWIENRQLHQDDSSDTRVYFEESLGRRVDTARRAFCGAIDLHLLQTDKPSHWINTMINRCSVLNARSKVDLELTKYKCIDQALNEMVAHLKQSDRAISGRLPGVSVHSSMISPIKWLKSRTVLVTLFKELLHGQDKGNAFIDATPDDIKRFIQTCFILKNGETLDDATFVRYWSSDSKGTAKIGSRVELRKLDE